MSLQRDIFISAIYEAARKDQSIVFLSADFGAEILDSYRESLPNQFMHCGISEQHMIDMAAGLALAGKKVYCYCMGPFWLRCYEQVKCSLAMMDLPVTLIGAGVGLGYADSGPTHYVAEDMACFRALANVEVWTAADNTAAAKMARLTLEDPKLRYIRLDREELPAVHHEAFDISRGWRNMRAGQTEGKTCILSSGYMLHRAIEAAAGWVDVDVIDLFRLNPIPGDLVETLSDYHFLVTVEEQTGGFGGAVVEALADAGILILVNRLQLPHRYIFENGGRAHLLDSFGLSVDSISEAIDNLSLAI